MNEDEAKKRWCPYARDGAASNRADMADDGKNLVPAWPATCACIASSCMAWRWDIEPMEGAPDQDIAAHLGHCGLAGHLT